MKKSRIFLINILLICFSAVLLLCACGQNGASAAAGGLVMDKKYVRDATEEGKQNYFLFHADGTGEYSRFYVPSTPYVEHYVVQFKYFYADAEQSAVVCFFDGWKKFDDHKAADVRDDTVYLLTVSAHVLTGQNSYFVNEDDVAKLPNYAKS